jgi:hypothetical protein
MKKNLILLSHGLHSYVGHEYTYTKYLKVGLSDKYNVIILSRKDIHKDIEIELTALPIFSKVEYNQEQNIFRKVVALIRREIKWFFEFRKFMKGYIERHSVGEGTILYIHTVSIYNVWSWVFHTKWLASRNIKSYITLRYSSYLLPRRLRSVYYKVLTMFDNRTVTFSTDTLVLANDLYRKANKEVRVLPVPFAERSYGTLKIDSGKGLINVSYVGAARYDKGFHLLPKIIEEAIQHYGPKVKFTIQASVSGIGHLESQCEGAYLSIINLQHLHPQSIRVIEGGLSDQEYYSLLLSSDIILLLYEGMTYKEQSSGILIEAGGMAKPVVYPSNTWIQSEIEELQAAGVSYCGKKSPYYALKELIDNYDEYKNIAEKSRSKFLGKHNVKAFISSVKSMVD